MPEPEEKTTEGTEETEGKEEEKKLKVLKEVEKSGKKIILSCTPDDLVAYIQVLKVQPYFDIRFEELKEVIDEENIVMKDEHLEALDMYVRRINDPMVDENEKFVPIVVAEGVKPVDGKDGRPEWHIEDPSRKHAPEQDERGYWDPRNMHAVLNVNEDDLLVTIVEPTMGIPGKDIFGKTIQAYNGKPYKLTRGKNVVYKEEEKSFYAETFGHVEFGNNTIAVEPLFVVEKSVDFNVGNINFIGSVLVNEDVKDGFVVRAKDHIEVKGIVNSAQLFAEQGDIKAEGGVFAQKERVFVEAGGSVYAKFLNNAKVDARENVIVEQEILSSEVNAAGRVIVKEGKIVGGSIRALTSIEAKIAGTPNATKTQLCLNINYFKTSETREIEEKLEQLDAIKRKIENTLGPILSDKNKLRSLPKKRLEDIKRLVGEVNTIDREVESLQSRRDEILEQFVQRIGNEIIVYEKLYAGVEVRIDTCVDFFMFDLDGPIKLKPNYATGRIQIIPL